MADSAHMDGARTSPPALKDGENSVPMPVGPVESLPEDTEEDRFELGARSGSELAMLTVARAWIDRWKAVGGHFGLAYNPDGSVRGVMMGKAEPRFWTPTDEGNVSLPPHMWIVEEQHQRGAAKALEGILELVPELSDTVLEIVGYQLLAQPSRGEA